MHWSPVAILEDFYKVAKLTRVGLLKSDIRIEQLPAPHLPPKKLPNGKMAIYVFTYGSYVLKVGKVGPNSQARYTSQHYNPNSAPSTLAASIIKEPKIIGVKGINEENISAWIKENTDRTNFIIVSSLGIQILTLFEAYLQCRLRPVFEGFKSQR